MKVVEFIIFIMLILCIYFLMHYYIFIRIAKGFDMSRKTRVFFAGFLLLASLTFVYTETISRICPLYPLAFAGSIWLGILSITFTMFLLKDLISLLIPHQAKMLTILAITISITLSIFSAWNTARPPRLKQLTIPLAKLPHSLSGFTIIHLSDLHLGILNTEEWLKSIVKIVNEIKPDVVVITGDIVEEKNCLNGDYHNIMKQINSKYGVLAVTGNHDFFVGIDNFLKFCDMANIKVLRNNAVVIADSFQVVGVDDDATKRFGGEQNLEKALRNTDKSLPTILLYHRPTKFKEAVEMGIDLQLSGHTHVGQIPPLDLIVWLVYKYHYGLRKLNNAYIYTTSGTGIWGTKMRLFSRSEIVKITVVPG